MSTYTLVNICSDCLVMDHNGWEEELIGRPLPDPTPMSLLNGYVLGTDCDDMDDAHAVDLANESHFSWTDCDGCGSSLGGDRYRMRAVLKSEEVSSCASI